jgi:HAD superfamily phosphoserine phosphatase-like hydrolase
MRNSLIRLVAFDLDGTLTRGWTVCEIIARQIGRLPRMKELECSETIEEIQAARAEMAEWYKTYSIPELCTYLKQVTVAPGSNEAFKQLRKKGIKTAIVSITWEFAVEWFARQFGADFYVGTKLLADGKIVHFWPEDKPEWVRSLAESLGLTLQQVAVIGDSSSDLPLLSSVKRAVFVGKIKPADPRHIIHMPDANIWEAVRSCYS